MKNIFILVFTYFCSLPVLAQVQLGTFLDAGKNNLIDGAIVKTGIVGDYQLGSFTLTGGAQFDLRGPTSKVFTGLLAQGAYAFSIKEFPLKIQGLFLFNPYSDMISEWNIGVLLASEHPHFTYKLGTHFRKYYITNNAQDELQIDENTSLYEKWNLVYLLGYTLKPRDHFWNVGITVTDIDYFLINQETNPMIYLRGSYAISTPLSVYLESWYKSAGTFNISANTFGYFFRTGIIWNVK